MYSWTRKVVRLGLQFGMSTVKRSRILSLSQFLLGSRLNIVNYVVVFERICITFDVTLSLWFLLKSLAACVKSWFLNHQIWVLLLLLNDFLRDIIIVNVVSAWRRIYLSTGHTGILSRF